jgi:hypothetical protein
MNDPVFPINSNSIPPMIARESLMNEVWNALTKPTPSSVSIVGPRWIGKTVLLKALADRALSDAKSPYSLVVHWHLGHVCPTTNEEFISGLCNQLRDAMSRSQHDYSELRDYLSNPSYTHLKEVTDLLHDDGRKILMIWDGFDKPLAQDSLSIQLWDQMRNIPYVTGHRIVTATRAPLCDLIRNEEAITSPFWNIFDTIRLRPFDERDQAVAVEKTDLQLTPGACTELNNWTGGHPRLLLAVLNQLANRRVGAAVDNTDVTSSAKDIADDIRGVLKMLWDDCNASAKDAYLSLVEKGEVPQNEIGTEVASFLKDHGFAVSSRNRLKPGCRLLREHILKSNPDAGSLNRLLGTWENYQSEIRSVLELRLLQIPIFNSDLHRWVARSIRDVPDHPGDCLMNLTDIEGKALDLALEHELGTDRHVPPELVEYWKDANHHELKVVSHLAGQIRRGEHPIVSRTDRALQCGLLQLLTGSKERLERKTKSISKDTFVLINAIHGLRNRKEHADEQPVSIDVAVSTMMLCLALLDCLARELA